MKRSTKVVLTLLVPAMAAFGCTQESSPSTIGQNAAGALAGESSSSDCDVPAKPGEPAKAPCGNHGTGGHSQTGVGHFGRRSFIPWFSGFRRMGTPTGTSHTSTDTHHSNSPSHSTSHTVHGGFGGTGSHLSGGS